MSDPRSPSRALFPGTFDPPTLGHVDLVERAAALFDEVIVAVAVHPSKQALFDVEQRLELLLRATEHVPGVSVEPLEGLVAPAAAARGARVIVRGVRSGTDLDYELPMAGTNRELAPDVDTVLLTAAPRFSHLSSTLVRQIAGLGGDVRAFVPACVAEALDHRFGSSGA